MDDINISGADFSSKMPKWATEETQKKLHKLFSTHLARDKREQAKVISLLNNISTNAKASTAKEKLMADELKAMRVLMKASNENLKRLVSKSTTTTKQTGSSSSAANSVQHREVVRELRETNRSIKALISDNNKSFKKMTETQSKAIAGVVSPINSVFDRINGKLGKGSINDRIEDSLSKRGRISHALGAATSNITGSKKLGSVVEKTTAMSGKLFSGLGSIFSKLGSLLKMIPVIGPIIAGLSSVGAIVAGTLKTMKEYSWDAQKDFKAMLKSGFSFGIETAQKGINMDAIKLHKMVNKSGLSIAEGMALMEKNAVLVNNLGVEEVFGTIDRVAKADEEGSMSFQDQMLMSRQEIGEFTTQYLASTMNIVRTSQNQERDRSKAARAYIQDARLFGQVTGQGMQVIIDKMNELRKSDRYRMAVLGKSAEQAQTLETASSLFSSFNMDDATKDIFINAMMDSRGLGLGGTEEGAMLRNQLAALAPDSNAINELDALMRNVSLGRVDGDQFKMQMADILSQFSTDRLQVNQGQAKLLADMNDQSSLRTIQVLTAFQQSNADAIRNGGGGTDARQVDELVNKQQKVESQIQQTKNAIESAKLWAIDSSASRMAMGGMLDAMSFAMQTGSDVTDWLLDNIATKTEGVRNTLSGGFKQLFSYFGKSDATAIKRANTEHKDLVNMMNNNSMRAIEEDNVLRRTELTEAGSYREKDGKYTFASSFGTLGGLSDYVESTLAAIISGDTSGAKNLAGLMSMQSLHGDDKERISEIIRETMARDNGAHSSAIYSALSSFGTVSKADVSAANAPSQEQSKIDQVNAENQAKREAETIARKEAEEAERVRRDEESKRAEEERKIAKETAEKQLAVATAATQAVVTSASSGAGNEVIAAQLNSVISLLGDVVKAQKDLTNKMTIEIIKA